MSTALIHILFFFDYLEHGDYVISLKLIVIKWTNNKTSSFSFSRFEVVWKIKYNIWMLEPKRGVQDMTQERFSFGYTIHHIKFIAVFFLLDRLVSFLFFHTDECNCIPMSKRFNRYLTLFIYLLLTCRYLSKTTIDIQGKYWFAFMHYLLWRMNWMLAKWK